MWDPEAKKKKMEELKTQTLQRSQLPPLSGRNGKPGEAVDTSGVMSQDQVLEWYKKNCQVVKKAYDPNNPPLVVKKISMDSYPREPGEDEREQ